MTRLSRSIEILVGTKIVHFLPTSKFSFTFFASLWIIPLLIADLPQKIHNCSALMQTQMQTIAYKAKVCFLTSGSFCTVPMTLQPHPLVLILASSFPSVFGRKDITRVGKSGSGLSPETFFPPSRYLCTVFRNKDATGRTPGGAASKPDVPKKAPVMVYGCSYTVFLHFSSQIFANLYFLSYLCSTLY